MSTLADRIATLKRRYWWETGHDAEALYVPRSRLRDFCQHAADEFPDMPPKHHLYHALSTGEGELTLFGLDVRVLTDGDDIGVGRPMDS